MPLPMPLEPPTTSTCLPLKSSSFIACDPSFCVLAHTFVEEFDHQNLVVISPVMFERPLFMAVRDKAHRFVKPARSFVLAHHGQLNHFHAPARMIENRRDKYFPKPGFSRCASYMHRSRQSLMSVLRTFLRDKTGYSDKPPVKESAKNIRGANARLEPRQRL